MYTIPDEKKLIIKTEDVIRENHLTIEDLLWEHAEICANLHGIVDNIPDRLM